MWITQCSWILLPQFYRKKSVKELYSKLVYLEKICVATNYSFSHIALAQKSPAQKDLKSQKPCITVSTLSTVCLQLQAFKLWKYYFQNCCCTKLIEFGISWVLSNHSHRSKQQADFKMLGFWRKNWSQEVKNKNPYMAQKIKFVKFSYFFAKILHKCFFFMPKDFPKCLTSFLNEK